MPIGLECELGQDELPYSPATTTRYVVFAINVANVAPYVMKSLGEGVPSALICVAKSAVPLAGTSETLETDVSVELVVPKTWNAGCAGGGRYERCRGRRQWSGRTADKRDPYAERSLIWRSLASKASARRNKGDEIDH